MHIFLILAAVALFMFFLFRQGEPQRKVLPAPISPYERDVSAAEFNEIVLEASKQVPVLVDFYASWCPPCHAFAPILAETAAEYNGSFLLARVNYDQARELVQRYQVKCVPTLALFKNGEQVDASEGAQLPHQLRYFLAKNGINQGAAAQIEAS